MEGLASLKSVNWGHGLRCGKWDPLLQDGPSAWCMDSSGTPGLHGAWGRAHGLSNCGAQASSCSAALGWITDQGSNKCSLHCKTDSIKLDPRKSDLFCGGNASQSSRPSLSLHLSFEVSDHLRLQPFRFFEPPLWGSFASSPSHNLLRCVLQWLCRQELGVWEITVALLPTNSFLCKKAKTKTMMVVIDQWGENGNKENLSWT